MHHKQPVTGIVKLPEDVRWQLQKCDGYLDLKMLDAAASELEKIPAEYRTSMPFREERLRLAMEAQHWREARELAAALREDSPTEPAYWIQLAYVVRRHEGIEPARLILLEALERFPKAAVISFNLACYECQLGALKQALLHLERAIKLDKSFRQLAAEDEDLEPLRAQMEP